VTKARKSLRQPSDRDYSRWWTTSQIWSSPSTEKSCV